MRAIIFSFISFVILVSSSLGSIAAQRFQSKQAAVTSTRAGGSVEASEFDRLRDEGNDALYNTDYKSAREAYLRLTKIAPDHPAGYVYLANNAWLETLFLTRRLSATLYAGGSFYDKDDQREKDDRVDPNREAEFNQWIEKAKELAEKRIQQNPKDVEALYYYAAALGLKAGYKTTVKRSFRGAISDANDSIAIQRRVIKLDPNFIDAKLSIGLYEYVIDSLPFFYRILARLAGLNGSKKKGIEYLETVVRQGRYTQDDARVLLIGIYTREGQPDRALEIISLLANKYPRNYIFGIERANMLYRMGRADEGTQVFADLLKSSRVSQEAVDMVNSQWGNALMAKGDFAQAIERYKEVMRWPKSESGLATLAHLRTGQALDALGKRADAEAEYRTVLKLENVYDSRKQAEQYLKKPYAPTKD